MLIQQRFGHGCVALFPTPLGRGFGQAAPTSPVVAAGRAFVDGVQNDIIGPAVEAAPFTLRSSPTVLRDALAPVCTIADPSIITDANSLGIFLSTLDCWLQEAFGWWTEVELIAGQTKHIGETLFAKYRQAFIEAGARADSEGIAFSKAFMDLGTVLSQTGTAILPFAARGKQLARLAQHLSGATRDLVTVFNDSVNTGLIDPNAPETAALRADLVQMVNAWKFQIVLRVVDTAFIARAFALEAAARNAEIITGQFELAATTPALLDLVEDLLEMVDELLAVLNPLSLPGRALDKLVSLPGDLLAGLGKGAGTGAEALLTPFIKAVAVIAGVGVIGIGSLILLRKYGVIGQVELRRRGQKQLPSKT